MSVEVGEQDCTEYVSKAVAAERLELSARRVLELSARGLLERHTVLDQVTKRRQTVFLAADLERFIEDLVTRGAEIAGLLEDLGTAPGGPIGPLVRLAAGREKRHQVHAKHAALVRERAHLLIPFVPGHIRQRRATSVRDRHRSAKGHRTHPDTLFAATRAAASTAG